MFNRHTPVTLMTLFVLGFGFRTARAADWYVDQKLSGNCPGTYDRNLRRCAPGSTGQTAYHTLQEAADVTAPGDTVLIREGTYTCAVTPFNPCYAAYGPVYIHKSGTPGQDITYKNYAGEKVILDAEGTYHEVGLYAHNVSYIVIDGFEAVRGLRAGFKIEGSDHITIQNSLSHDHPKIGTGFMAINSDQIVFRNDVAYHSNGGFIFHKTKNSLMEFNVAYENWNTLENADGMGSQLSTNNIYRFNIVFNNADDGIDVHGSLDNLIEYNIVFNNGDGPSREIPCADSVYQNQLCNVGSTCFVGCGDGNGIKTNTAWSGDSAGRNTLRHNVVFGNDARGFDQDSQGGRTIYGNTYQNNLSFENGSWGYLVEARNDFNGINVLRNNIGFNNGDAELALTRSNPSFYDSDYNLWEDKTGLAGQDTHSLSGDPRLFATGAVKQAAADLTAGSISANEFRNLVFSDLQPASSGSPVVDAGEKMADYHCLESDDLGAGSSETGCTHWMGRAPDIGAYEFGMTLDQIVSEPPSPNQSPGAPPPGKPLPPGSDSSQSATGFGLLKNVFNPSQGEKAEINYQLEAAGSLSVIIYDRNGREIRTLANEEAAAGAGAKSWDGRNASGELVSSGVYLIVMKVDGTAFKKKVVVLK